MRLLDTYADLDYISERLSPIGVISLSEDNSVVPPKWMQSAAKRGLELRAEQTPSNRCCTPVGLARARDISNGRPLSLKTIKRMKSFVARHCAKASKDKKSKQNQSLWIWGTDPKNCQKTIDWCDRQIKKLEGD